MPKDIEIPSLVDIPLHVDDRGSLHVPADRMDELGIKRVYLVHNFKEGMVRAWHGHKKADTYMHVLRGAVKLACLSMDDEQTFRVYNVDARKPQVLRIPGGWYNGAMSLTDDTLILVMSTMTFDELKSSGDDQRLDLDNVRNLNVRKIWEVKHR